MEEIQEVQALLLRAERSEEENNKIYDMTMRLARFLPSPSKMNAVSVLKSNSPEKVFKFLELNEEDIK